MSKARAWYRWKRRGRSEFWVLWIAAVATYGVGDTVTTLWLVTATSLAFEANPLVRWSLATGGVPAFLALKTTSMLVGMALSRRALATRDLWLYYIPPVGMILTGLAATALHLRALL